MKNEKREEILSGEALDDSLSLDRDLRRIATAIADLPDRQPPAGLVSAVMENLPPRRWGSIRRMWWQLRSPVSFSPLKIAGLGFSLVATIFFAFVFSSVGPDKAPLSTDPLPSRETSATVVFTLEMPDATSVKLVGSFNRWNPEGVALRWDDVQKHWTVSLPLEKGRHEYAFLVDGKRLVQDPKALLQNEDGFGNRNSVLIIERDNGYEAQI